MDAKRIKFERTGGFAGIRFAADIELDKIPKDQAQQILDLLDGMGFDKLPEKILGSQQVPDGFMYSVTVVTGTREQTVTTTDLAAPEKMKPLLDLLTQAARQQAMKK